MPGTSILEMLGCGVLQCLHLHDGRMAGCRGVRGCLDAAEGRELAATSSVRARRDCRGSREIAVGRGHLPWSACRGPEIAAGRERLPRARAEPW
jgi:hypothetical protein